MIFVLTNDDGYQSEKFKHTKEVLGKFGTVYTVAPRVEQSAKSMGLTIGGFNFEKIDEYNYIVDGTPVDCTSFALVGLGLNPDLLVSGTNNGYNIGVDTRYSGTVGACLQAQYLGYQTLALSADNRGNKIFQNELEKTIKFILENKLYSSEYTLNVNFPRDTFDVSKGIKHTKLHYFKFDYTPEIIDNKYVPNRSYIEDVNLEENTDTWAYINGYTSISKIKV